MRGWKLERGHRGCGEGGRAREPESCWVLSWPWRVRLNQWGQQRAQKPGGKDRGQGPQTPAGGSTGRVMTGIDVKGTEGTRARR